MPNSNGKLLPVEYTMVGSRVGEQRIFAVLIRDVSEREEMQLRIFQMDRLVSVGTVAAGVVHEIKNPLTYVINNIHLAAEEIDELRDQLRAVHNGENLRVYLDDADASLESAGDGADRVRRIVDDMKVFAHRQPGGVHPVSVVRAIELALRMTRGEVRRVARIETSFDDVAPVDADETRLSQVFVNLVMNAAQAMQEIPEGEHILRLEVEQQDHEVLARVRDTGPGMPDSVSRRIFQPFFTTKSAEKGTGLGLSLSKAIIEDFGGRIAMHSEPGAGTVFEVRLPISSGPGNKTASSADR